MVSECSEVVLGDRPC